MWLGRLPKVWSAPIIHIGKITSTSPKSARNQDQPPKLCPYCKTSWKISLDFPKALDFHFFVHSAFTSIEAALAAESLLSRKQASSSSFLNGKRYFQNGQGVECTLNISQFFDKCTQYCTFNLDPLTFFKKKVCVIQNLDAWSFFMASHSSLVPKRSQGQLKEKPSPWTKIKYYLFFHQVFCFLLTLGLGRQLKSNKQCWTLAYSQSCANILWKVVP